MKIALLGNPNSGKSSLFNQLTGLNQKVGNFPGVTVDKKEGICKLNEGEKVEIVDLPGTYSLYPKSADESIVFEMLISPLEEEKPDLAVVVVDASNLKRNLLLFTQVKDLGIPVILVLNLMDVAESKGIKINVSILRKHFQVDVLTINARKGKNISELKGIIAKNLREINQYPVAKFPLVETSFYASELTKEIKNLFQLKNNYLAFQYAHQFDSLHFLNPNQKEQIREIIKKNRFDTVKLQAKETLARYEIIEDILKKAIEKDMQESEKISFSERLDKVLLHRLWGYLIFFTLLFLIFQAIFSWATYPMDWIDRAIGNLQNYIKIQLPSGVFNDLLTDGILAGVGGIFIFIPQIAILFAFISILEESGFMARVVFLMDKLMRKFGLNGKSIVPLISGVACAVPAIMATRSIDNWKERLITIFITPLMSCSARLPVYAVLIALVVPADTVLYFFNLQGLALMGMYLLGFVMALFSAWVMKKILKTAEKSYLIMELPDYKIPHWTNVAYTVGEKVRIFVWEAGKIILAISIILWGLASYGPPEAMNKAKRTALEYKRKNGNSRETENQILSLKLEASYAGQLGKFIEPVIAPLGYDWKIGIALITSFAAREVFVGTLSTIYSLGNKSEDLNTIKKRLEAEINPDTGKARYTPALAFSLLVFYAFALQCMSTVAVVYRETKGWKWPLIQFIYLTALAYLAAFVVYNLMN